MLWAAALPAQSRDIPRLTSVFYDETGKLSHLEIVELEKSLIDLADSVQVGLIGVMLDTLGGYEIEDITLEIARPLDVTPYKKEVFVLVSMRPRKAWIYPSIAAEKIISDKELNRIYERVLRPALQAGDFSVAFKTTFEAILAAMTKTPQKEK
jgi:uncharacterized membrane protein YgcG